MLSGSWGVRRVRGRSLQCVGCGSMPAMWCRRRSVPPFAGWPGMCRVRRMMPYPQTDLFTESAGGRRIQITDSAMVILKQLATQTTGSCPVDFMTSCHTARYGARIYDLRAVGLTIEKSKCRFGPHNHQRRATRYHLVLGDTEQVQFVSPSGGFVQWRL